MQIIDVEKVLNQEGISFTKQGDALKVKLDAWSGPVKIDYDWDKRALAFSSYQGLMMLVSFLMIVSSMANLGDGKYAWGGVLLALGLINLTNIVLTEVKLIDLKRSLQKHQKAAPESMQ